MGTSRSPALDTGRDLAELLGAVRGGDRIALGEILERFRNYLELIAQLEIGRRLRGKADPADLVQETFLEAARHFGQFRGLAEPELAAWLRRILAGRIARLIRRYLGTRRRDLRLERELAEELSRSSQITAQNLIASLSSPSQRAARREQGVILADALNRLPADYRTVIVLRQLEGLAFAEVADRMDKSLDSVKKLWVRALGKLRDELGEVL